MSVASVVFVSCYNRSGKTSLIHSLAGELGLDIYVVSLSSKGYGVSRRRVPGLTHVCRSMSDDTLAKLMGNVPSRCAKRRRGSLTLAKRTPYHRCILLLEDLDAAFTRGISRDENSTGAPTKATAPTAKEKKEEEDNSSTLTLSGLLNSLDGVAAAEGR